MEPTADFCVSSAPALTGWQRVKPVRGSYRVSPQGAALNKVLMKGLAGVIRDRRLTSPQIRALLGQPESVDGHLRDEVAAIRQHAGDLVTWKRLLVFCDALKVEAGDLIARHYAGSAGRGLH